VEAIAGNATQILAAANLAKARTLLVAIPDTFEAGQIVQQARALNPTLEIIARAHSDAEADHLRSYGASSVVLGEQELANALIEQYTRTELQPPAPSAAS
jgi:CPA2 family monovalent cation:H+ antiporter-2